MGSIAILGPLTVFYYFQILSLLLICFTVSFSTTAPQSAPIPVLKRPFSCAGTDDFYRLVVQDGAYVDKSRLIKEYTRFNEIILITRPSRWGKSINLNMVKRFLDIEVDGDGRPVPEDDRVNRALFTGGAVRYDCNKTRHLHPLKISKSASSMSLQGTHPVISLNFKNIGGQNYPQFVKSVRDNIRFLFGEYGYFKNHLKGAELEAFVSCRSGTAGFCRLRRCVLFLCKLLRQRFDRKVHILIDEYDAPLRVILTNLLKTKSLDEALKSSDFEKSASLIQEILTVSLNHNPYLEQALLTGILPMGKTRTTCGLSNIEQYNVLDARFSRFFGFSQFELNKLLTRYSLEKNRKLLRQWYNGYNFAGRLTYNPYTVMNCLRDGVVYGQYWERNANSMELVNYSMLSSNNNLQEKIHTLAIKGRVAANIDIYRGINITEPTNLFALLLVVGYLTPARSSTAHGCKVQLKIPNFEIRESYRARITEWRRARFPELEEKEITCKMGLLAEYKFVEFETWLQTIFFQINFYDEDGRAKQQTDFNEKFYANCIFLLAFELENYYEIRPQMTSGDGRADLVMIARHARGDAIIFEFKVAKSLRSLKSKSEKALTQINGKKYDFALSQPRYDYIENVTKIGAAFFRQWLKLKISVDKRPIVESEEYYSYLQQAAA